MKRIQVAIIGQGRSGRDIHGQYIQNHTRKFKIVAAVDPIRDRRERAAQEYKCDVYEDYTELFRRDDLDLVINSTPSDLHVDVTLDLLKRGYNVLCEKPLAARVKDVDRMIRTAKQADRVLAIYQQSRFAPYFQQVRKVMDSGVLGRIVQIDVAFSGFGRRWDWQTLKARNGGSLLNTGPHPMDQALSLFGFDKMPKVFCHMDRAATLGNAEDHVVVVLQGRDRPMIHVEVSSSRAYPKPIYTVFGTLGGMIADSKKAEWKYFKPREAPQQKLQRQPISKEDGTPAYCSEQLKWHEGAWEDTGKQGLFNSMAASFYNMLHKHMTQGAPLEITPEQVRRQIQVIEECHKQNPQIYSR
ncbi:Gfo/Idh/MocA family oxidoreductase [bacterium]|nr:Gfo/Idh/MocA family oxidoreductase [bacterium]